MIVKKIVVVFWKLFLHSTNVFDVYHKALNVVGSHNRELTIKLVFEVYPVLEVKLTSICRANDVYHSKMIPYFNIDIACVRIRWKYKASEA